MKTPEAFNEIIRKHALGIPVPESEKAAMKEWANKLAQKKQTEPIPETKKEPNTRYAKNQSELCRVIKISLRDHRRWTSHAKAPRPAANGSHDIAAWIAFYRDVVGRDDIGTPPDMQELKARKLEIEIEDRKHRLEIRKGLHYPREEANETFHSAISEGKAIRDKKFLDELPPVLEGLDKFRIRDELLKALRESDDATSAKYAELAAKYRRIEEESSMRKHLKIAQPKKKIARKK